MAFTSKDIQVGAQSYTITDEAKACELELMKELINQLRRLANS